MVENVQCPVCTLFLHAGMNLSDHLETHPKEQVIKALVQLTITGSGVGGVVAPSLASDTKEELEEKPFAEDDPVVGGNGGGSSISLQSSASCIPSNSLNFVNAFSTIPRKQKQNSKPVCNATKTMITDRSDIAGSESTATEVAPAICLDVVSTSDLNASLTNRYQPHTKQTSQCGVTSQFQAPQQQMQQKHQILSHHQIGNAVGFTNSQHISLSVTPSPQVSCQKLTQLASDLPQQQPPSLLSNTVSQRNSQIPSVQQTQQQKQQNLKIFYSASLPPPPPPLQMFSFHPPPQTQHQKPPPAYGTAISQIRSQHNQNKKQATIKNQQQPIKQKQQQHHPQNVRLSQSLQQTVSASNSPKQLIESSSLVPLISSKPAEPTNSHQPRLGMTSSMPNATAIGAHQTQHSRPYFLNNIAHKAMAHQKHATGSYRTGISTASALAPAILQGSSPGAGSVSSAASRQTSSPFASLLVTTVQSSSSVLRYAESPVAHYLERDNGDFIVQESPKHVVECVEKDDGEFSVIERIYQSPPSVLHIHDDDDKDDDDTENTDVSKRKTDLVDENINTEKSSEDFKMETNDHLASKNKNNSVKTEGTNGAVVADKSKDITFSNDNENTSKVMNANVLNNAPSNSSVALSSDTNFSLSSNPSSSLNANSTSSSTKTKNTITVLSDVQLNLNEYLDLVGNIMASKQRRAKLSGTGPIPLLKVEKIEPPDEYEQQQQVEKLRQNELLLASDLKAGTIVNEPPTNANKNETEDLVENNCNSNKTRINTDENKDISIVDCTMEPSSGDGEQNSRVTADVVTAAPYSSHVTSVIRMATTSQLQQKNNHHSSEEKNGDKADVIVIADSFGSVLLDCADGNKINESTMDQSQTQGKEKQNNLQHSLKVHQKKEIPLQNVSAVVQPKKGPKKLVIKPKVSKTDANANNNKNICNNTHEETTTENLQNMLSEIPTTSAKAQIELQSQKVQQKQAHFASETLSESIVIKCEPSSVSYERSVGSSILEQHLKLKKTTHIEVECKKERTNLHESLLISQKQPQQTDCILLKDERESNSQENVADDAQVLLDFANSKKHDSTTAVANFLSSSSIFSNTSAPISNSLDNSEHPQTTVLRCDDEFSATDVVQEIVVSSSYSSQSASDVALNGSSTAVSTTNIAGCQQQQNNSFTDYSFSFLYGNGNGPHTDVKGSFSSIYQQEAQDATTAATLASGSNTIQTDDSTNSLHTGQQQHFKQQYHANHFGGVNSNTDAQWYRQAVSTANTDFETALAVDCNVEIESDVGKYLDLDSCKREALVGVQGAPSSTSSSFTVATESSLAGGCTTDALNIRTDEKMPAKGEISGQESNCDIDNSWSQPMCGEISTRFFKNSFPGIFQYENWNQEDYFTVQDLSTSAAPNTGGMVGIPHNKPNKSFDFRLPLEASTSTMAVGNSSSDNNFHIFSQHIDNLPSTSANKKKRKRDLQGRSKVTISKTQPTATVTSQQLFAHQHLQQQVPQHQELLVEMQQYNPSTSTDAAGSSTSAATNMNTQQLRQRKKVYRCTQCTAEFSKLKDRNSHMILEHNYKRQNRRLICSQTQGISSTTTVTSNDVVVANMSSNPAGSIQNVDCIEDSKQGIVKIEVENTELQSTMAVGQNVNPKTEMVDEKDGMLLATTSSSNNVVGNTVDGIGDIETKPTVQTMPVTTPATKLATLYRMLVSYNFATLAQNNTLSEIDQKLIETYIFFCYECRRSFSSVKLYDAHLAEHPAECFTCGKKFQRWKNFSLHLKRHLGWKEFGCNVCEKKFVVRSALVEHVRMHTGFTPLKCKVCGKLFKRYSNLTQHRKRHAAQIRRKKEYVCHCGEVLPSKARFFWHKETHDSKPKCCPYCCDRFVHANSLRRHIRLAHSDKFNYTEPMECPMCKQIFAKASIKAHMATHSMDTQHDCPICNKSFSTKWNLKIHSWVHANRTAKPFKCEHCPKAFVREVDFKNHMNAHKQIKPYTCEYCGCKFIRKYNYMRHRREHHGNKKFTCDLCKKSFHRHYYLIEHRRIHTGERPFQCTICGKSSTTKTNHNKHLKIHHSRDPFTVEA